MKPRLLDLFCGAGGASMGYSRAGFEVVGVDIKPQPRYPFEFHQADAMTYPLDGFDAIHASPPCQRYSMATPHARRSNHPDLIANTRRALENSGKPWIMENVPGAPLRADLTLCGCLFDLELRRKRLFETNWSGLVLVATCQHLHPVVSVVGHGTPSWVRKALGFNPSTQDYRKAMDIDWMTRDELSQAIPPPYTEYIGNLLRGYLGR